MGDIADFLAARIYDDEQAAREIPKAAIDEVTSPPPQFLEVAAGNPERHGLDPWQHDAALPTSWLGIPRYTYMLRRMINPSDGSEQLVYAG